MFLKQLDITGFKSFAGKTRLELEPGMTAVVGPNGSGKSNIADAIKWALGEQSARTLRGKKHEELVFAGTEKRARASMAEVSLLFDSSDSKLDLDFSEVQISRRLYRSGESEYRINGRKARVTDIQQLLAQAGLGTSSYAVIAQGMMDTLILASPVERKILFDEASGIRQYEVKREQATRKLQETRGNMDRIQDILSELAPRVSSLERSAAHARAHQNLEKELQDKRRDLVSSAHTFYEEEAQSCERLLAEDTQRQAELEASISGLTHSREEIEAASKHRLELLEQLTRKLQVAELRRDECGNSLNVKRAQLQFLQEQLQDETKLTGEVEESEQALRVHNTRGVDLKRKLEVARQEVDQATQELDQINAQIKQSQNGLVTLRKQSSQANDQEYVNHALGILRNVAQGLALGTLGGEELKLMIYKAGRLLGFASKQTQSELLAEVRVIQGQLSTLMNRRESLHERYTGCIIRMRSLELDMVRFEQEETRLVRELDAAKKRLEKQRPTLHKNLAKKEVEVTKAQERLESVATVVAELRNNLSLGQKDTDTAHDIFQLATTMEAQRAELVRISERSANTKTRLAEAHRQQQHFALKAQEWFGTTKSPAGEKGDIETLLHDVAALGSQVEAGRATDAETLAEYEEVNGRYQFLSGQLEDLTTASNDLNSIIGELDKVIRERFEAAFEEISEHFSKYFKRLFGDGRAKLTLTKDESDNYGINISAVPHGKRVESLNMLSGGERALTGIALLAAILAVNPSPFVVLDEVDAALDEANSGRFADILGELAEKSQLIVITHNRQTMQAAHTLFGVTMDDNHVSRLLSLRLEEAAAMAARD